MSTTLLGICDNKNQFDVHTNDWNINKIGGKPIWLDEKINNISCQICRGCLLFICQLCCPLDNLNYDRILYIFACSNKNCFNKSESWLVLRCQKIYAKKAIEVSTVFQINSPFGTIDSDCLDWEMDSANQSENLNNILPHLLKVEIGKSKIINKESGFFASKTQDLSSFDNKIIINDLLITESISDIKIENEEIYNNKCPSTNFSEYNNNLQVIPDLNENFSIEILKKSVLTNLLQQNLISTNENNSLVVDPIELIPYYIDVVNEEDYYDDDTYEYENHLLQQYLNQEGLAMSDLNMPNYFINKSSTKNNNNIENYEKIYPQNYTSTQENFLTVVKRCPKQIIRYSHSGNELFFDNPLDKNISACICGSERVFEMQLMPELLYCLHINDKKHKTNENLMDFSCVYIYTCSANCWLDDVDKYKVESVYLQADDTLSSKPCKSNKKGNFIFN